MTWGNKFFSALADLTGVKVFPNQNKPRPERNFFGNYSYPYDAARQTGMRNFFIEPY